MKTSYKGKVALVTGGARGLGKKIALDFAQRGANVAIADLREKELEETAREIEALGTRAFPLRVDLAEKTGCESMIAEASQKAGPVDFLVNNAGVVWNRDVADLEDRMIRTMVEVNLMAQIWTTRAVLPAMIERGEGTIVCVASAAGRVATPAMNVYAATKFALIGYHDALRHELRKSGSGVKVVMVCPGYMDTKMFVGAKVPLGVSLTDPQKVSKALMKALDKGKEEIYVPKNTHLLAIHRVMFPPKMTERLIEMTGMHESFYESRTED